MNTDTQRFRIGFGNSPGDQMRSDRQAMALEALTSLARQFSNNPDLGNLVENIILTLSGQFAVSNAFAALIPPEGTGGIECYFAFGRFKTDSLLSSVELTEEHAAYFCENDEPQPVSRLKLSGKSSNLQFVLLERGVNLVIPLIQKNNLIGIIGLGDRVNRKDFEESDIAMLAAFANTITPLIVNSFLFHEISTLSDWYLQILNSVKQGVFVFDDGFNLKKVNIPGFEMLRRFNAKIPHIDALFDVPMELVFPESTMPGWCQELLRLKDGRTRSMVKKFKATIDSKEHFFNVRAGLITFETTASFDLIVTLDDVTEQEENEQKLFDLEKFAEKGIMASSISHELNNFLGMIMGGVELTQMALEKDDSDKVAQTLIKIRDAVDQMERFTHGLMDYARLDTQKQAGNLNHLINDVLSFVSVQRRYKNNDIQAQLDASLPEFQFDPDQMAQLLLNLLNNASDAIREAARPKGSIIVRTAATADGITLTVEDNGAGIDPEIKDRLFNNRLTTKEHGHGYGLVTCSKIVENHFGQIEIDSEPGKGASFKITFPIDSNL